jgi:hypothetical protein
LRELTKAVIGLHLSLRLAQFGWGGEGLRDGLPVLLAGEAKVGTVSGMMGLPQVPRVAVIDPLRKSGSRTISWKILLRCCSSS